MIASVELLFENNNASSSSMWQCVHNVEGIKLQHRIGLQHKKVEPVTLVAGAAAHPATASACTTAATIGKGLWGVATNPNMGICYVLGLYFQCAFSGNMSMTGAAPTNGYPRSEKK